MRYLYFCFFLLLIENNTHVSDCILNLYFYYPTSFDYYFFRLVLISFIICALLSTKFVKLRYIF